MIRRLRGHFWPEECLRSETAVGRRLHRSLVWLEFRGPVLSVILTLKCGWKFKGRGWTGQCFSQSWWVCDGGLGGAGGGCVRQGDLRICWWRARGVSCRPLTPSPICSVVLGKGINKDESWTFPSVGRKSNPGLNLVLVTFIGFRFFNVRYITLNVTDVFSVGDRLYYCSYRD